MSSMNLHHLLDELRTQRDELAVQMHLAGAEARDEWQKLEKKFEHVRGKAQVFGHEAQEVAGEVGDALRQVIDELRNGYARLRALIR